MENLEQLSVKGLKETYDGMSFLEYQRKNGQKMSDLQKELMDIMKDGDLTVPVAKGFLDYIKIVIESRSTLPKTK